MKSKSVERTKEQQERYDSCLPKRYKKRGKLERVEKIMSRIEYMNNCIYWLNEYYSGRANKERAIKALQALKNHCSELIIELQSQP